MSEATIWSTTEYEHDVNFDDHQQNEADKKLVAVFFKGAIKNEVKSAAEGRPIFDSIDFIRILTPGSRDTFVGDATMEYQMRFPMQWQRYKNQQSQDVGSTPLTQINWLSVEQIAEFNALQVKTVEQLAGMPDAVAHKFMGFHAFRTRAQNYLDLAKERAPIDKMERELRLRDEKLAEQQETIDNLVKKVEALAKANTAPTGA